MYLELQLSASAFGRAVRNRIRALDLARDASFPNPLGPGTLVVDSIVVGDSTVVQREKTIQIVGGAPVTIDAATQHKVCLTSVGSFDEFTVPYVQVKQEIDISLVLESDLDANGTSPSTPAYRVPIFPVFNVGLSNTGFTQGGGPMTMSYQLAYVDLGLFGASLDDAQRAMITELVGGVDLAPSTVDLSALTGVLGRPVAAINSGFACDPDGTRVALRVDFDVRASPFAVRQEFFEQGPDDLLAGLDWAMLVDADVLIQTAQPLIKKALDAQTGMQILSDPVASWDAPANTLRVNAAIRLLAVCPGFIDDIDMDVAIRLAVQYSIGPGHSLDTHYQLDHDLIDGGQIFGCVVTGALLYPFAGAALFVTAKIGPVDFLGGIVFGPFVTVGQLLGVINAQQLEADISTSLGNTCHKVNDSEYQCSQRVPLGIELVPGRTAQLVLDATRGVGAGLVLGGSFGLAELDLGPVNGIRTTGFAWRIDGRCNANRDGGGRFPTVNMAAIDVDVDAPPRVALPARVVVARVLADPSGVFTVAVSGPHVTVSANINAAYRVAPYACVVRLVTTRSVRDIDLGLALDQTAADESQLSTSLHNWQNFCAKIALTTIPFDELFRVPTGPTPPIETFGVDRWMLLRQLTVQDLEPGSRLALRLGAVGHGDGDALGVAEPSSDGTAHLAALVESATPMAVTSLEVELDGSQRDVAAHPMTQHHIIYAHRATVQFDDELLGVRLTETAEGQTLTAVGPHRESRWDISLGAVPTVTEHLPAPATFDRDQATDHALPRRPEHGRPVHGVPAAVRAYGASGPAGVPSFAGCAFGGNMLVTGDNGNGELDVFEAVHVGLPQPVPTDQDQNG